MNVSHLSNTVPENGAYTELKSRIETDKKRLLILTIAASIIAVAGLFFVLSTHGVFPGVNIISSIGVIGGFTLGYGVLLAGTICIIVAAVKRNQVSESKLIATVQSYLSKSQTSDAEAPLEYIARNGQEEAFLSSPATTAKMARCFGPHLMKVNQQLEEGMRNNHSNEVVTRLLSLTENVSHSTKEEIEKILELYDLALQFACINNSTLKVYEHFNAHFLSQDRALDPTWADRFAQILLALATKEHEANRFENSDHCFTTFASYFPMENRFLTLPHLNLWIDGLIFLNKAEQILNIPLLTCHSEGVITSLLSLAEKASHSTEEEMEETIGLYDLAFRFACQNNTSLGIEQITTHFLSHNQAVDPKWKERFAYILLTVATKEYEAKRFKNSVLCFSTLSSHLPQESQILNHHHLILWIRGLVVLNRFAEAEQILNNPNLTKNSQVDEVVTALLSLAENEGHSTEEEIKRTLEFYHLALQFAGSNNCTLKVYEHFNAKFLSLPLVADVQDSWKVSLATFLQKLATKEYEAKRFENSVNCLKTIAFLFEREKGRFLTFNYLILGASSLVSLNKFEEAAKILDSLQLTENALTHKDCFSLYCQIGDFHYGKYGVRNRLQNLLFGDPYFELKEAVKFYKKAVEKASIADFHELEQKLRPIFSSYKGNDYGLTEAIYEKGLALLRDASFEETKILLPELLKINDLLNCGNKYKLYDAIWKKALSLTEGLNPEQTNDCLKYFFKTTDSQCPADDFEIGETLTARALSYQDKGNLEMAALFFLFAMRPKSGKNIVISRIKKEEGLSPKTDVMLMHRKKREAMLALIGVIERLSADGSKRAFALNLLNDAIEFRGDIAIFFTLSEDKKTHLKIVTCEVEGLVKADDTFAFDVGAKLHFLKASLLEQMRADPSLISEQYIMAASLAPQNPFGALSLFLEDNLPANHPEAIPTYKKLALKWM